VNAPVERRVPCPRCAKPSLFSPANRWRPFCSERCHAIDLGAWSSETYKVAEQPAADIDPARESGQQ
jgi:hypothetical protein